MDFSATAMLVSVVARCKRKWIVLLLCLAIGIFLGSAGLTHWPVTFVIPNDAEPALSKEWDSWYGQSRLLHQAVERYRTLASSRSWPAIPEGSPGIPLLRERLEAEDDLAPDVPVTNIWDARLEAALRHYQKRHGLVPSGTLDHPTREALNVPWQERIRELQINEDRCRFVSAPSSDLRIVVNTANFTLIAFRRGKAPVRMRVIVGKRFRRTPVFTSHIESITLNPAWHVPRQIAVLDLLPQARQHPHFFQDNHFQIFDRFLPNGASIDPASIDWTTMTPDRFTYRLVQEPGPWNSLGNMRFNFPNAYGVYLHGTPAKELFKKRVRAFSAGCIRLENPLNLAVILLQSDPSWTRASLERALASGKEKYIPVRVSASIEVVYLTAWVDEKGVLQFRKDVYGRDLP